MALGGAMAKLNFAQISELLRKGELIEATIVANKLNRSYWTVRNWIQQGKVEGVKVGGRVYVWRKSLDGLISRNF